jgi:hypothetical protein
MFQINRGLLDNAANTNVVLPTPQTAAHVRSSGCSCVARKGGRISKMRYYYTGNISNILTIGFGMSS